VLLPLLALKLHLNVTYGILGDLVGVFYSFLVTLWKLTIITACITKGLRFSVLQMLACRNLQATEVVNCKIKIVYVNIQTVLDRLAIYPLVAY